MTKTVNSMSFRIGHSLPFNATFSQRLRQHRFFSKATAIRRSDRLAALSNALARKHDE